MEQQLSEEEIKKKMKADLFKFQLQTQSFDDKINKLIKEKMTLEKANRTLTKEGKPENDPLIIKNKEKLGKISEKIKNLMGDKEKCLGIECNSIFTDDTNLRPNVNIK